MASYSGSGPNHVQFDRPDFSGGKVKNKTKAEGGASPSGTGHTLTLRYAFGKDHLEAFDNLKTSAAITHYSGPLALPMDWEHEDDSAALGYAFEHIVKNPDGSLHERLRVAFDVTLGVGGARAATSPRKAVGYEAKLIRSATGYDYQFVWRPVAGGGFLRTKVQNAATFNQLWLPSVEIDEIDKSVFDVMPTDSAYDIGAGSRLIKDGATVYLVIASAWTAAGLAAARKFQFASPACFNYCGFDLAEIVDASSLAWPAGISLAGLPAGAQIDYSDVVILAS